jgi:hypothetical protein
MIWLRVDESALCMTVLRQNWARDRDSALLPGWGTQAATHQQSQQMLTYTPILVQLNSVNVFITYISEMPFNIILTYI